ncbi:GMC family oxidoreductase [Thermomonas sp.]|uniref:GMC family oxidoreductase n=1 Tax=Thermomonas sp. TaxID=1971895 RepID=UPI0031BA925E
MNATQQYDAVVVGAGAGGAAAAWRMAMKRWRVLLVDAGPAFDPAHDYALDQPDWERRQFPHKPGSLGETSFAPMQSLDPALADLRSWSLGQGVTNHGTERTVSGPGYHHVRGIGGSTLHFVGESHRMNPASMQMHSRFGVGADWPVSYADLEPYYLEVERFLGVAGPDEPRDRWRSAPYPLPAHPLSRASRKLATGAAALGLDWDPNPRCALSRPYDGRPPCNYCGGCTLGCPRRDKASADITFVAKARASGHCDIRPNTTLVRIVRGARRRVDAVELLGEGGRQRVLTKRLVLAGGAIETPRMLLLEPGLLPTGSQVGRNFLESVAWTSVGRADEPLLSFGGLPADAISWKHNRPDAVPGVVGGFRVSAAIHESGMVGAIAHAQRAVPGFGIEHKQQLRQAVGSTVATGAVGESLPSARSWVDLDPQQRDALGRPLARIHSHVDLMTVRRLRAMAEVTRGLLKSSGIPTLVEEYGTYDYFSSAHVFGTCRMGTDPRKSVVDADLRVHGFDNLYVCDASVFPSSGGGEAPTLTIQALVLRAVDRMG